jgi:hypothetical protein
MMVLDFFDKKGDSLACVVTSLLQVAKRKTTIRDHPYQSD